MQLNWYIRFLYEFYADKYKELIINSDLQFRKIHVYIDVSMVIVKLITTINKLLIFVSVNISHVTVLLKQCRFR